MDPCVSVVVPTYNRAGLLRRTLRALMRQTLDCDKYEVIVVDNGSTDHTRDVVEEFASRERGCGLDEVPKVRCVFEPERGLSHAKNAGFMEAQGEFVAYTDDDAIPSADWLSTILEDFGTVQPSPDVVGGPAFPLFVGHRPCWYRESYETHQWGDTARFMRRGEALFGLNVAFRRESLVRAGGFDTSLGMTGETLGMGEDTEIFKRLSPDGEGLAFAYYDPSAFVHHLIPDSRTRALYQVERAFVCGQAWYRMDRLGQRSRTSGLAYQGLRLAWYSIWAGVTLPLARHAGDWLVGRVSPVAASLGYFAAAAGVHPGLKRAE